MPMMPIAELARITNWTAATVKGKLKTMAHTDGPGGSKLYESHLALPLMYGGADATELSLQSERARLAFHQANKAELDEKLAGGELLAVDDVEKIWSKQIASLRAKLLAMPVKLAAGLLGIETKAEIRATATKMINDALTSLSTSTTEDIDDAELPADERQLPGQPKGRGRGKAKQAREAGSAGEEPVPHKRAKKAKAPAKRKSGTTAANRHKAAGTST